MAIESVLIGKSSWHLEHGDAMDVLRRLPDGSVDAVIADPPYGIAYRSKRLGRIVNDDQPYIWWLREAWRVTREGGVCLCFCRWDVEEPFRWAMRIAGFKVRSQVIWDRRLPGKGDIVAGFSPSHDSVWFGTKGRGFRWRSGRPRSVIPVQKLVGRQLTHPTEKPLGLLETLVKAVTVPGEIVLDPFAGSASTGHAAIANGRRFVGCELDADHVRNATRRLNLLAAATDARGPGYGPGTVGPVAA